MKKFLTIICAVALMAALPAAAFGRSDRAQARLDAIKTCKELRAAAGKKAFAELYGHNAYGKCVSRESRENVTEARQARQDAHADAVTECKAEQAQTDADFSAAHGGETFAQYYDGNAGGKSAYGKCVSRHNSSNLREERARNKRQDKNQVNAATQCRQERGDETFSDPQAHPEHNGQTFADFYGTNENNRNAFGKCVSKKAHEMNQADEDGQAQA